MLMDSLYLARISIAGLITYRCYLAILHLLTARIPLQSHAPVAGILRSRLAILAA